MTALAGPRTRRIDLAGRTLLPSFQDAHVHPSMAGVGLLRCPLHELPRTLEAYQDAIRRYAAANPDAPWVLGDGWYMEAFPGGDTAPRGPGCGGARTGRRSSSTATATARGRTAARSRSPGSPATRPTPPTAGSSATPNGEPTGTLHEGAMEDVKRILPPATVEDRAKGIELAQAYLHRLGITAWQDAWVTPDDLAAYRLAAERDRLTARVVAGLWWERERGGEQIDGMIEQRRTGQVGRLRATTVKIMLDGVAENYTAAMLHPYLDGHGRSTSNRGISFVDPELLKGYVTRLDAEGFQVHFHALGDRAVREGLDAIEAARTRERTERQPAPPGAPAGRRPGRRGAVPDAGRDRQHAAVLGVQRPADGRADAALPAARPVRAAVPVPLAAPRGGRSWPAAATGRSARRTCWPRSRWR